jgi:hypothetical protein
MSQTQAEIIKDASINTLDIIDGAITTNKVQNGAITKEKLAASVNSGYDPFTTRGFNIPL